MAVSKKIILVLGISLLAACQPKAIAPPPPAPVIVAAPPPIPSIPLPPLGAAAGLTIPPLDVDGTRSSPNKDIGPEETLWHVRSAYNVAALTCQQGSWKQMAPDYNAFLQKHRSRLSTANSAIERKFQRENSGRVGRRARDTHITSLYNYFSLPPVKTRFCSTMFDKATELSQLSSTELGDYAKTTLPQIDAIFTDFYNAYEAYERDLADWNARYGS